MMIDNLPHPIMTDVLEVISAASESLDCHLVRQKALDALFHCIPAEGAIFFLPDGNARFTRIMVKNLDKKYRGYYKAHFHQFDPLQLIQGMRNRKRINRLEDVVSYDSFQSTEYYNEFLKPQGIHHKLIVYLLAEKELHGKIVLTRPQNSSHFTKNEVQRAKIISPYLAHALAHNDLRKTVKLKGDILNYIENQSSCGMLLLDEALQVIYKNQKADEIFSHFEGSGSAACSKAQVFSQLMKDCREIRAILKGCPMGGTVLPKQRVVKGFNHTRFSVISKAFGQERGWEDSRLFMVSIEEIPTPADISPQHLMDTFHLSNREIHVATLLFSGLKNAEIAEKLFITEITVKKHLQSIYDKVGVNNRTSLINRMLTR
ncbi:MAG: helix-turn-helix transcriptional regulator [Deltaproteobacteria bacterium]|nr:helix-turn-helix transcriptional regulator [Deltaproteobacteria bacterium]